MKKIIEHSTIAIIAGLAIAAFTVADRNIGMVLGAIAIGLTVFVVVLDADIRIRL